MVTLPLIAIYLTLPLYLSERITCDTSNNCAGQEIVCNATNTQDTECEIQCNDDASCQNSIVSCADNKHCNIICNSNTACQAMTVNCPQNNGDNATSFDCNIGGFRAYSLHNMNFNCRGSECSVICNGVASCLNATFDGSHVNSNLLIKCNDNARDQAANEVNFACKNINVYCRENENNLKFCKIEDISAAKQTTPHTDLRIHAKNSWNDIDLTQYAPNILHGTMSCGHDFNSSCNIDNVTNDEWNCINQSSLCYVQYSSNDGDDEDENYGLIIGLSIAAFFCLLIALCIGLYLRKDEEAFAEKYDEEHAKNEKRYYDLKKQQQENEELDDLKTPLSADRPGARSVTVVTEINEDDESEDFLAYKELMRQIFYAFAGYQPWAKKTGLYMQKKELQTFLDIVNIEDPADEVLRMIDTDDVDGRIVMTEWMEYFTDKRLNPAIFQIKHHIEQQVTWELLCRAIQIFSATDQDHTGKLEYGEFAQFGDSIGLNEQETEILWNTMDTDRSGSISIVELFEWFRFRLHQQTGRITQSRQPSLCCSQSDLEDFSEFRHKAHKVSVPESVNESK